MSNRGRPRVRHFLLSKYAFVDLWRNPRRTFSTALGLVLAVAVVSGLFVSVDSSSRVIFDRLLDKVPVDFVGFSENPDTENSSIALSSIDGIVEVGAVAQKVFGNPTPFSVTLGVWQDNDSFAWISVHAVESSFPNVSGRLRLGGISAVESGHVVISAHLTSSLDVRKGDAVVLRSEVCPQDSDNGIDCALFYNSITVGDVFSPELVDGQEVSPYHNTDCFILMDDAEIVSESLNLTLEPEFRYFLWMDRGELDPYNPVSSRESVMRLLQSLNDVGEEHDIFFSETNELVSSLDSFVSLLGDLRLTLLAVSLPVVGLGLYVGIIGSDLAMEERRRTIGVLRSRGASDGQLKTIFVLESLMLGVFSGLSGLVVGILASGLFMLSAPLGSQFSFEWLQFYVSETTTLLSVALAVGLSLIAGYQSARRASEMRIAESLRQFEPESQRVDYRPRWDLMLAFVGLIPLILMILSRYDLVGAEIIDLLCTPSLTLLALAPLSPFLIVFGITRLLTRGTTKTYDLASRATRPFTGELCSLVNRNVRRNPRRVSNLCVVIAIAIAVGIFVSATAESQLEFSKREIEAGVGTDISAEGHSNLSLVDTIESIDGVQEVCPLTWMSTRDGVVTAANFSRYMQLIEPDEYFFIEGKRDLALDSLIDNGSALVNSPFAERTSLHVGDSFSIDVPNEREWGETSEYVFVVEGVVRMLPGLERDEVPPTVYVDIRSLYQTNLSGIMPMRFLVDVEDGYDSAFVGQNIVDASQDTVYAQTLHEELVKASSDPLKNIEYHFLMLILGFVVVVMTSGLAIVLISSIVERRKEFASLVCRGASYRQVASVVIGEGTTTILVSYSIGIFGGILSSFVFNEILATEVATLVSRPLVLGFQTLGLLIVSLISLFLGALLATLLIRRMNVFQVLREGGG